MKGKTEGEYLLPLQIALLVACQQKELRHDD